ncbi:ParB/RepB/Spo0J family partition protein/type I secretion C-terminal target domain (VC_A0849 subclass) [Faunimonas pinastri]|uniref:ParB/RepB/Spo0J family partition protein/type I secretion C-terminal target domain (VC_A0849 subclass) n=1 Tax=Faunimonas pinastri TaxID=1855383 RepID=A0A1H9MTR3_9HYPH|nr:ParB N-terminal domain-containing protein [Faunimonas pinastri]SER26523.1 ParB/RepB/Spo0J family partition protein/type I secretion C-terminal target domain (VC_A0849 subclass) [Faunimonas pinastri]
MAEALSLDPALLRANDWNTNFVSPENETKLDEAIKRFGFFKPIIVREVGDDYEILGGEHRWESAQRLGLKEVPVMNLGPIDDQKAKEISLADNARYGADDTLSLADLLKDIGTADDLQQFLPYTDADITSIFSSVDIALDELELDENFDKSAEIEEPPAAKAPKTHTVMRFKVSIGDSERLTALIAQTQKRFGYTSSDDLTNAGDALIHLVMGAEGLEETDEA